jgi:hypothetical protein
MSTCVHWVWLTNACTRNDCILGLSSKVQMRPVSLVVAYAIGEDRLGVY